MYETTGAANPRTLENELELSARVVNLTHSYRNLRDECEQLEKVLNEAARELDDMRSRDPVLRGLVKATNLRAQLVDERAALHDSGGFGQINGGGVAQSGRRL